MNFDKEDLFRNAIPGYIFLVVILSFYAVTNRLDHIEGTAGDLMLAVSGIPLGFLIQSIYRVTLHIGLLREQDKMEKDDARAIPQEVLNAVLSKFRPPNLNDAQGIFSQWLALSLNREENKPFRDRINFLISYVHALGASSLAIFLALPFIIFVKIQYFGLCVCFEGSTLMYSPSSLHDFVLGWICPIWKTIPLLGNVYCIKHPAWQLCLPENETYDMGIRLFLFTSCFVLWLVVGVLLWVTRWIIISRAYKISRNLFIKFAKLDEGKSWLFIAQ